MSNRILQEERERNLKLIKEERGLWDNIHAKRKRGESPAEKGDEDYPEKDAWKKAQKEGSAEDMQSKIASDFGLPKTNRMKDKEAKSMQSKVASDFDLPTSDRSADDLRNKIASDMNLNVEEKRKIAEDDLSEAFLDKDWIKALSSAFNAEISVDKEKKVSPIYGGGSHCFIGYLISLNEPEGVVTDIILEGFQINGKFVDSSVILKIAGSWQVHANLGIPYNSRVTTEENISQVIDAVKKKLSGYMNEQKKSLSEESTQNISHFTQIESPDHLDSLISQGAIGGNWNDVDDTTKESVIFVRTPKRQDELNMSAEEYKDANYDEFYDNEHNGAGKWAYKQNLEEVFDAGEEWGLKIVITARLDV